MEKTECTSSLSSSLLIFISGVGAGVALAGLLTPRSGAATRRIIGRKVDEGTDWVKERAATAQSYVRTQADDLRDRAMDVAEVIGRR